MFELKRTAVLGGILSLVCGMEAASPANRFTHLDSGDPFYVGLDFPRLTTPQWIGEEGVEAVMILAIDDLRDGGVKKYEGYLRPILERLKAIDGRAPLSIMTVRADPKEPHLQKWIEEGVSIEAHTLTHPCPLLKNGDFGKARSEVLAGLDELAKIPNQQVVAYRMPCCDSMNSASPRFFADIFNTRSPGGHFLQIDTSIMNLTTANDAELPPEWLTDPAGGRPRFRKYFATEVNQITRKSLENFAAYVEDYPYPFTVGRLCWEFPPMVPSDWEAFNLQGRNHPRTLEDYKVALDVAVKKRGAFTLCFHPHGWIQSSQVVELIEHAASRHGSKVKFLNFREALERLNRNLLAGHSLRAPNGEDNGVRLLDLNDDGFLDVLIGSGNVRLTRIWNPRENSWKETRLPFVLSAEAPGGHRWDYGVRFGVVAGQVVALVRNEQFSGAWVFEQDGWTSKPNLLDGLNLKGSPIYTVKAFRDRGVRLRDVDRDGSCEIIVGNHEENAVFQWQTEENRWEPMGFGLPAETGIVNELGQDNGLRFVDVNLDGFEDVMFSNESRWSLNLYVTNPVPRLGWVAGWSHVSREGRRGDAGGIPPFVRSGRFRNNGAWFRDHALWVQNEDTAELPDHVERHSFKELLSFPVPEPSSPEEAPATFSTAPGFEVQLVAQEPRVIDPVAFEWGGDGRLWVVEMRDYPNGTDGRGKPGGVVKFLEDEDGDGVYEKATVFLDGIGFPSGVMPWREGVLISAAPEVVYAEDTDGDGKADVRKTLLKGFKEGNQQHRVNGFQLGLDGWVHAANGDSGGAIQVVGALQRDGGWPEEPVSISGRDFRFQPDTGAFEPTSGRTQFGRNRDDFGNWFGNNNPNWLWHYHLPERYLRRNRNLEVRSTKRMLAQYEDASRCWPSSRTLTRWNQPHSANHVTSACSASPYRDELPGADSRNWVLISEPVHNLVHREVLEADGVSFRTRRHPDDNESEFLRSSDSWFRPTMVKTGPDGAVYVADMYRFVIEHPEWISPEAQAAVDVRLGDDKGRIYRVLPNGVKRRPFAPLKGLNPGELARRMDSPNGWVRDTAQRLLQHAEDASSAGPGLTRLALLAGDPAVRLQALSTLATLKLLSAEILEAGWKDADPRVRAGAVELTESLASMAGPKRERLEQVLPALFELARDPDARVRFQLAFTLGELDTGGDALAGLAIREFDNPDMRLAVLSSLPGHLDAVQGAVAHSLRNQAPVATGLVADLAGLGAALDRGKVVGSIFSLILSPQLKQTDAWRLEALGKTLDRTGRKGWSFDRILKNQGAFETDLRADFDALVQQSVEQAANPELKTGVRTAAIGLLGHVSRTGNPMAIETVAALLSPRQPEAVQKAAIDALAESRRAEMADALLGRWSTLSPERRAQVMELLLSRRDWSERLLNAVEQKRLKPGQIAPAYRQRLLSHRTDALRKRAEGLLGGAGSERAEIVKRYRSVGRLAGNPESGKALFTQNCAVCHQFGGEGNAVGPDLAAMAGKSIDDWITAIFNPNAAVEDKFISYTAVMKNEEELTGIIVSESGSSVTLKTAAGTEQTILRDRIERLHGSGVSLMPEGFEAAFPPQKVADLIAFLSTGKGS